MLGRRADRRRVDRRAFRPTLDGRLEAKLLQAAHIGKFGFLYPAGHIQTAMNGQAVDITTQSGQAFFISVQGGGTVRASAMSGGRFGLRLLGTNIQSVVTISPVIDSQVVHTAHVFNTRQAQYSGMINIGAISVATGMVNDIEGYKTAVLSGPLIAMGTNPIDRLAFDAIAPGANIITGGDVNTLDVATSVILSGPGTGINIGRDLNFFSTFGDVDVVNGANFIVGRDIGLTAQPAKGTGPSSIPANALTLVGTSTTVIFNGYNAFSIQGNVFVAPGSQFVVAGAIDAALNVSGTFTGFNNFVTQGLRAAPNNVNGSIQILGDNAFANLPINNGANGTIPGIYPIVFT